MHHKRHKNWFSYLLVLCIGYIPLTACSKDMPRYSKDSKSSKSPFSYALSFDEKGLPVVLGANDRPIPAKIVEGPIDAKKILRVRNFSVIDVEGSHFILININGTMYQVNFPD